MSAAAEAPQGVSHCRSCGADIVWLPTVNGSRMPIEFETFEPGDVMFEHGKHISHFSRCPHAERWRKP